MKTKMRIVEEKHSLALEMKVNPLTEFFLQPPDHNFFLNMWSQYSIILILENIGRICKL